MTDSSRRSGSAKGKARRPKPVSCQSTSPILPAPTCAGERGVDPLIIAATQLEPVQWAHLDGWAADDHAAEFKTFLVSCKPFLAVKRPHDPRPVYGGLWQACRRAAAAKPADAAAARKF